MRMLPKILIVACGFFYCFAVSADDSIKTLYGNLSVSKDNVLLINGKKTQPIVQGDYSLYFEKQVSNGDKVGVLVANNTGGSACPVQFRWVVLGQGSVNVSPEFGTCSDLAKVSVKDNIFIVELPKYGTSRKKTYFFDGSKIIEK